MNKETEINQDTILKTRTDSLFFAHRQVLVFYFGDRLGISEPELTPRQLCSPHPLLSLPTRIQGADVFHALSQSLESFCPVEMM